MKNKVILCLSVLFLIASCSQRNPKVEEHTSKSNAKVSKTESDSVHNFQQAVESLTAINYYISGKDSIKIANDPTYFIEMNGILSCFQNSFDNDKSGLAAYKNVRKVHKFHVAQNKNQNGPQANIIQLEFDSSATATKWFQQLESSNRFSIVKNKPKTNIWVKGKYVYFIQSYYDTDRKILNEITQHFREKLNKNQTN